MNRAYDIEDSRPWWKRRLISIALTIGLALFIAVYRQRRTIDVNRINLMRW